MAHNTGHLGEKPPIAGVGLKRRVSVALSPPQDGRGKEDAAATYGTGHRDVPSVY